MENSQLGSSGSGTNEEIAYLVFIGNFTKDISKNQIDKVINSINSIDSSWIYENSFKESQDIQLNNKANNKLYLTIGSIIVFINVIVLSYNFISSIDEKIKDLAILKAVGWNNNKLLFFTLFEPILLVLISGILVCLLIYGILDLYLAIYFPGNFLSFNLKIAIYFFGLVLISGLFASIYYIWKIKTLKLANVLKT